MAWPPSAARPARPDPRDPMPRPRISRACGTVPVSDALPTVTRLLGLRRPPAVQSPWRYAYVCVDVQARGQRPRQPGGSGGLPTNKVAKRNRRFVNRRIDAAGSWGAPRPNLVRCQNDYVATHSHLRHAAPRRSASQPHPALHQRRADAGPRLHRLQVGQLPREAKGQEVGRGPARPAPLLEREEVLRDGRHQPGAADQDRAVPRHAPGCRARCLHRGAVRPARRGATRVVRGHPRPDRARVGPAALRHLRRVRRAAGGVGVAGAGAPGRAQGRPRLRRESAVPRHRSHRRYRPGEHVVLHQRAEPARPLDGLPLRRRRDAQAHPARAGLHQRRPQRGAHRRRLRQRRGHRRPEDLLGLHQPSGPHDGVHRRRQGDRYRRHEGASASTRGTWRRSSSSPSPR